MIGYFLPLPMPFLKKSWPYALFILLLGVYGYIAWNLERQHFSMLAGTFVVAWLISGLLYWKASSNRLLLFTGLAARVLFLWATPSLSDDYFRFLWDGLLAHEGVNPFQYVPRELMDAGRAGALQGLYHAMNSPEYYSVYPPVCQWVFFLATFSPALGVQLLTMRLVLCLADLFNCYLLKSLLGNQSRKAFLYFLNPLVIVETVGNLHFEGLMLAFLLLALYCWKNGHVYVSTLPFSLAVCVKMLPLMFMPVMAYQLGWKKGFLWGSLTLAGVACWFAPYINLQLLTHLGSSLNLYFQKFEFNASIYYLVRWVGYQVKGYNIIQTAGLYLSAVVLVASVWLAVYKRDTSFHDTAWRLALLLALYFFLATIVHPWYIVTLVALGILSGLQFPLVWSCTAVLSYAAYQSADYQENLGLVAISYLAVYGTLAYEYWQKKEKVKHFFSGLHLFSHYRTPKRSA